jgi:hypothetical protein
VSQRIDPVALAVAAIAPDRVAQVVEEAFSLNVRLVDHALSGKRRALGDQVWRQAATALAVAVAQQPTDTLTMLTNAVLTLAATPPARPQEWIARMASLGSLVHADTMAATGQLVAWRSGMAQYRSGAIAIADSLPEPLALAAIGAEGPAPGSSQLSWQALREALVADRWWGHTTQTASHAVGGFVGFGGPFTTPPQVRSTEQDFLVCSGEQTWLLIADAFGATLHLTDRSDYRRAKRAVAVADELVEMPSERLEAAMTADSIAFTSPYSYFVLVRPWKP